MEIVKTLKVLSPLTSSLFDYKEDGVIHNSHLPVILYKNAIDLTDSTEWLETDF